MLKKLILAFSNYPSPQRSPEAADLKYDEKSRILQVRGNVYARLKGELSQERRNALIEASHRVDELEEHLNI